jgi:hypothetical protein
MKNTIILCFLFVSCAPTTYYSINYIIVDTPNQTSTYRPNDNWFEFKRHMIILNRGMEEVELLRQDDSVFVGESGKKYKLSVTDSLITLTRPNHITKFFIYRTVKK